MEFTRILVATDFSEQADAAFDQAIHIARRTGADVVAAFATPDRWPGDHPARDFPWSVDDYPRLVRERLQACEQHLQELKECGQKLGITVSTQLITDFPDTGIPSAAATLGADLIAIGTRGRGGFARALLGSTALRVLRGAMQHVLIARPATADGHYHRVLVPTDFSPNAEFALQAALILTAPGGTIDLVHFWQAPPDLWGPFAPPDPDVSSLRRALWESAERDGTRLIEQYRGGPVEVRFAHAEGAPVRGIQGHLTDGEYDLAVLGSHGRRGPRRWVLGSVAEATAMHAPCSVLVIRGEQ